MTPSSTHNGFYDLTFQGEVEQDTNCTFDFQVYCGYCVFDPKDECMSVHPEGTESICTLPAKAQKEEEEHRVSDGGHRVLALGGTEQLTSPDASPGTMTIYKVSKIKVLEPADDSKAYLKVMHPLINTHSLSLSHTYT
jgi:hypothetical protein